MASSMRVGVVGLMCAVAFGWTRPAAGNSAPLLQVAPLLYDSLTAHEVRVRVPAQPIPSFARASSAPRPMALIPLYGAFAALQAADAHSTTQALRHGGVEVNPLMSDLSGSPKGLLAIKLATTASTIVATEMLWRSHPKAAVIMMTIITSGYGVIVAHNYRVAH